MPTPRRNGATSATSPAAPQPVAPETTTAATPAATLETTPIETPEASALEGVSVDLGTRTIVGVTKADPKKYGKNRIFIELDGEPFDAYNAKGEACLTNSFGININTLAKAICRYNPYFNLAYVKAKALKKELRADIIALALQNSEVDVTRIHKNANDIRETGIDGDTYENDIWKTIITAMIPKVDDFSKMYLAQQIKADDIYEASEEEKKKPKVEDLF